jgi:hypothetical protein
VEITGFGTDFVIDSSFRSRVVHFIRSQRERWPSLYFNGTPAADSFGDQWILKADPEADSADILTFSSGPEMEEFWEERGYDLNENGEGPFSLLYRFRRSWIGARLQDVEAAEQAVEAANEGVELLLPEFFTVCLVTPADPAEDDFSRSVVDDFRGSFER